MSCSFDTSGFTSLVANLSQISGKEYDSVLRDQTGQLMGLCIRYTGIGNKEKIAKNVAWQISHTLSLENGTKIKISQNDNIWLIDRSNWKSHKRKVSAPAKEYNGHTFHLMNGNRHWSNERWALYQSLRAQMANDGTTDEYRSRIKVALRAVGLTKSTWQQIADELGAGDKTKAPAYVRNSRTFHGASVPKIGGATTTSDSTGHFIDISNTSRLLTRGPSKHFRGDASSLNGFGILQRAMNARVSAFQHEMENGVFTDIEARAKRYPGIFTTHASA